MGKRRDKRRRNAQKPWERTKQEKEIVGALEAEGAEFRKRIQKEAEGAELWRDLKKGSGRASSDPPVFGEPDPPVRAPLRPRPNLRSGGIAIQEPGPAVEFLALKPRLI